MPNNDTLAALPYETLLQEVAGHRFPRSTLGALADEAGRGALRRAEPCDLVKTAGLSAATARRLCAAIALGRHIDREISNRKRIASSADVYRRFRDLCRAERESFWVLALDARHRELRRECVAVGSLSRCAVRPADVLAPLLRHGAAAAVLVHNHPSGDLSPSGDDEQLTLRLLEGAELVGITLLDHVVVARGGYVSLRDRGVWARGNGPRTRPGAPTAAYRGSRPAGR